MAAASLPFWMPWRRSGALAATIMIFAFGFAAGAIVRPTPTLLNARVDRALADDPQSGSAALQMPTATAVPGYPAEVIRVIDGDTFEARVRVWPGLDVSTKVRLRNIDAPELHARCADELAKAQAARAALEAMLATGGVIISRVGIDKYGGRIDALVATRQTPDVSAALLQGGWARSYTGGRRGNWC
jgi:endonuclease YncB( thermonuclease family)